MVLVVAGMVPLLANSDLEQLTSGDPAGSIALTLFCGMISLPPDRHCKFTLGSV